MTNHLVPAQSEYEEEITVPKILNKTIIQILLDFVEQYEKTPEHEDDYLLQKTSDKLLGLVMNEFYRDAKMHTDDAVQQILVAADIFNDVLRKARHQNIRVEFYPCEDCMSVRIDNIAKVEPLYTAPDDDDENDEEFSDNSDDEENADDEIAVKITGLEDENDVPDELPHPSKIN